MTTINIFVFIVSIIILLYTLPYANWEYKNSNKFGGIFIYIIAFITVVSSGINL